MLIPDSPQAHVRRGVLLSGKLLIMPSPRLRKGFMLLDPKKIPRRFLIRPQQLGAPSNMENYALLKS